MRSSRKKTSSMMPRFVGTMAVLTVAALTVATSDSIPGKPKAGSGARPSKHADAQVATQWFDLLYHAVRVERLPPMVAARVYGYAGMTLYESVAPGMPQHRSLAGQLNELPPMPVTRKGRPFHWPTVANSAMAEVARGLMPAATPPTVDAINALEAELEGAFPRLPRLIHDWSATQGRAVARAILQWAAGDDFAALNNCPYTPPPGPGLWIPTPPLFRPALQPCWGDLRPMVLTSGGECAPPPPPAFSTDPNSAFFAEGNEVFMTGNAGANLTAEQKEIALFWADDPGTTGTPAGHWISIVGQVARERGLTLAQAAEAYALVGIAVNDAFIACWDTKYRDNLLRPVTYIQSNMDSAWLPLLGTPPFPEYTSGHSTQSGAASFVLSDLLGDLDFTDDTHAFRGLPARSFSSFEEAAEEAALSRIYGGIHYRAAIEVGLDQGRCIGGAILDRVQFRKH